MLNSFSSVRGVRHAVVEGKTAEISVQQVRTLLKSINISTVVGLRDKAILGALAYTGARVGAVAKLRLSDYRDMGAQKVLRFREKGGKDREIPVRHDLEEWLHEYVQVAAIGEENHSTPLFRSAEKNRPALTGKPFSAHLVRQMLKRRLEDAGLPELFSPHSFRVTVVTDLLNQNVPLEDVQVLAGHSSPQQRHESTTGGGGRLHATSSRESPSETPSGTVARARPLLIGPPHNNGGVRSVVEGW